MASKTGIEYVDATWNPWSGCNPVSEGCEHCYARLMSLRFNRPFSKVTCAPGNRFYEPERWKTAKRILVCSMSDFFHEAADEWRSRAWAVIRDLAPQHTYMLLTKRPENIQQRLPLEWNGGWRELAKFPYICPPNIWLGVTVESKVERWRINVLRNILSARRWLSLEPLLHDLGGLDLERISWVICGGESGPGARPMNPDWARSIRDQCKAAGVPFFMKQMSGRAPIPKDLQIKEYPK